MHQYNDFAIPIAWPDQTARGDELWFAALKKLGIVKNLNFKVGHAAIVLVERKTGDLRYFDFGRYIVPRGFGRARSSEFDPRLELESKGKFDENNELINLEEILHELAMKESATHGSGRLLCSICAHISFQKGVEFAESLVEKGPILYGAIAPNNNSCSRYVAQILVNSMVKTDARCNKILFPECLKASPTSNVVNAIEHKMLYCFHNLKLKKWEMSRWESLKFQLALVKPNFFNKHSHELPDDLLLGFIEEPQRPDDLPESAQWLGGLGEGCWFSISLIADEVEITRFNHQGEVDYSVIGNCDDSFNIFNEFKFTYHVHHKRHVIKQSDNDLVFKTLTTNSLNLKQSI